jgi:monoamine oxidase
VPIELGAEFVHGGAAMLEKLGAGRLGLALASNRHFRAASDRLEPRDTMRSPLESLVELASAWLDAHPNADGPVSEILNDLARDPELAGEARLLRGYVQGFHGADPDTFSIRALVREETSGQSSAIGYRPLAGYDELVRAMARALDPRSIALRSVVRRVAWSTAGVEIDAISGLERQSVRFSARRLIVTVPLGVLQAPAGSEGVIDFQPALSAKHRALSGLAAGPVVRLVLRFREPFWESGLPKLPEEDARALGFLHGGTTPFPTFWTEQPTRAPLLVAWAGGPSAERLAALDGAGLTRAALTSLSAIMGVAEERLRAELVATYGHDWVRDPYARGAYTYTRPGGIEAARELGLPLGGVLFFAGEATHAEGEVGTVHGAVETGLRAAREVSSVS